MGRDPIKITRGYRSGHTVRADLSVYNPGIFFFDITAPYRPEEKLRRLSTAIKVRQKAVADNLEDSLLRLHNLLYRLLSRETCLREPNSQRLEELNNTFQVSSLSS